MPLVQLTFAAEEPVSLDRAKLHLRQDETDDDDLIRALVTAARKWCEVRLRQCLVTASWRLSLDGFPCGAGMIELPRPPLRSVTSVKYYDAANVERTVSSTYYDVDVASRPGRLVPAWGYTWPATYPRLNAVNVEFSAGYGDADDVPETIRQAILLLVGHWYANREAVAVGTITKPVEFSVESLLGCDDHGSYGLAGGDDD